MYKLTKKILFQLEPETAHNISLQTLKFSSILFRQKLPDNPKKLFNLTFPNTIGLAAGLDKNGDYINALGSLGFGFLELGTVTPKPQLGNPKPRLFRLTNHNAIINRMGFNNKGVLHLSNNLKRKKYRGIIGVNIGKNKDTDNAKAYLDYCYCLERVYSQADYIVINISSPNTPNLRDLQNIANLDLLLKKINIKKNELAAKFNCVKPILVKLAPDIDNSNLRAMLDVILNNQISGIVATNTTIDKTKINNLPTYMEQGGLSGAPLTALACEKLAAIRSWVGKDFPIIGVGGIMSEQDAKDRIKAGADLLQIYSGLIYHGPSLIKQLNNFLSP